MLTYLYILVTPYHVWARTQHRAHGMFVAALSPESRCHGAMSSRGTKTVRSEVKQAVQALGPGKGSQAPTQELVLQTLLQEGWAHSVPKAVFL